MALKNAAKVHAKWRDLLRQAKKTELQKQVQHIAEAHEHAMQSRGKLMEARPPSSAGSWPSGVALLARNSVSHAGRGRSQIPHLWGYHYSATLQLPSKPLPAERSPALQWLIADVAEAQRMHKHAADEHLSVVSGLLELQGDRLNSILADFQAKVQVCYALP